MTKLFLRTNGRQSFLVAITILSLVAMGLAETSAGATTKAAAIPLNQGFSPAQASKEVTNLEGAIPAATGDTTRGISGHTITIEGVADVTAGGQTVTPGACDGAKARFAAANRDGGVNGYKINYVGCSDSEMSGPLALQDLQKAVDVDHAFAIVPMSASMVSGTFLNSNHVPYFGSGEGLAYCPGWTSVEYGFSEEGGVSCNLSPKSPDVSPITDQVVSVVAAGLKKPESTLKWALIADNLSFLSKLQDGYAQVVKDLGGKVVYNQTPMPAPGAPPLSDYTPTAEQVINSGANVVDIVYITGSPLYGFIQALRANGYKGAIYSQSGTGLTDPTDLSNASLTNIINGVYVGQQNAGTTAFPNSAVNEIGKDLDAIGLSSVNPNDLGVIGSFASADFFLDALAHVKGTLTAEKLVNLINGGFTYPGIGSSSKSYAVGPETFPGMRLSEPGLVGLLRIENGKLEPIVPMTYDYTKIFFLAGA